MRIKLVRLLSLSHCFVLRPSSFHPQAEGSKLQRDLRAYLEAVKGAPHMQAHFNLHTAQHVGMHIQYMHHNLQMTRVLFSTAMHESSKNVQACLNDMYEPEWYGKREVESIVEVRDTFIFEICV